MESVAKSQPTYYDPHRVFKVRDEQRWVGIACLLRPTWQSPRNQALTRADTAWLLIFDTETRAPIFPLHSAEYV